METALETISIKEAFLKSLTGAQHLPVVDALSKAGIEALESLDFPSTRMEDWKYTRTSKISKLGLRMASNLESYPVEDIPELNSIRLVFVNGVFDPEQSRLRITPSGVHIHHLKKGAQLEGFNDSVIGQLIPTERDIFTAMNAAYHQDGLFLKVEKNCVIDEVIEVVFASTGSNTASFPRNFIHLEEGAEAKVLIRIESEGSQDCFINGVTECVLGNNASLQIDKLQLNGKGSYQLFSEEISQGTDSRFAIRNFMHASDWIRNSLNIALEGSNAETHLSGAYLLSGKQHIDNHTIVDHKLPHCISKELYKGLIDDKATGVFNGKVFVREDAQKTEAYQSNANILLSDDATMNSKPELEIYADDVKCSHGSTTGQFDEDAVFYLRARGLDTNSAYRLLTTAFIGEVVQQIESSPIKNYVTRSMNLGDIFLDMD